MDFIEHFANILRIYIYIYIYINSIKRNRETCSSHFRAFSRTALSQKKSRIFRKVGLGCPWKIQPPHISYGPLTQICPGYPGQNPEDVVASFFVGTNFPKYSRYFGKIVAIHHFLEIFRIFREPFSRNIPNISGNAIIEISGIFRKNCLECNYRNFRDIAEKWSGL